MKTNVWHGLFAMAVVALAASAWAATPDPVLGTWTLNVAKSSFGSGPKYTSQTRTYSQSGDSITLVMKSTMADGKEATMQTTYKLDGKDYPVSGAPDWDSLSGKQVDERTAEFTLKKGGKAVGTTDRKVSRDGKKLMTRQSMTNSKGEKMSSELVFDRQTSN